MTDAECGFQGEKGDVSSPDMVQMLKALGADDKCIERMRKKSLELNAAVSLNEAEGLAALAGMMSSIPPSNGQLEIGYEDLDHQKDGCGNIMARVHELIWEVTKMRCILQNVSSVSQFSGGNTATVNLTTMQHPVELYDMYAKHSELFDEGQALHGRLKSCGDISGSSIAAKTLSSVRIIQNISTETKQQLKDHMKNIMDTISEFRVAKELNAAGKAMDQSKKEALYDTKKRNDDRLDSILEEFKDNVSSDLAQQSEINIEYCSIDNTPIEASSVINLEFNKVIDKLSFMAIENADEFITKTLNTHEVDETYTQPFGDDDEYYDEYYDDMYYDEGIQENQND